MPIPGAPNSTPIKKRNIEVDAALQGVVSNRSIHLADPQALFDSGQAVARPLTPVAPAAFVTTTDIHASVAQGMDLCRNAPVVYIFSP